MIDHQDDTLELLAEIHDGEQEHPEHSADYLAGWNAAQEAAVAAASKVTTNSEELRFEDPYLLGYHHGAFAAFDAVRRVQPGSPS